MRIEITEAVWLDEHRELSLMELVELSGLSVDELHHLVDCEALQPISGATHVRFRADCLALVRTASRLRSDFDLDVNGLALALRLLGRIRELETDLHELRALLPHSAHSS
jgi:chaperone modulatory protein CbpM